MKKLIVCRHGEIDADRRLSLRGEAQIRDLSELLRPHVVGDVSEVLVMTSTALRAIGSARILIHALGIPGTRVHRDDLLWSGDGPKPRDDFAALVYVETLAPHAETLVVVTHLEYCLSLPSGYALRNGLKSVPPQLAVNRGQARVLDCETGECVTVGGSGS